jgi:hypothetical protein
VNNFKQIILATYRLFIAVHGNILDFLTKYKKAATEHLEIAPDADTPWVRVRVFSVLTWGEGRKMQPNNPDYWGRAEALIIQLKNLGLGIDLDLEDGNSLDQPRQIDDHWFITKVMAFSLRFKELSKKLNQAPKTFTDADATEFTQLALGYYDMSNWFEALKLERKIYMKKWVDLLNKHNVDWRICIINEPPWTLKTFDSFYFWHYSYLRAKDGCDVPLYRIIATTHIDYLQKGRSAPCGILAPHDVWLAEDILPLPKSITDKFKILWSADGREGFPTNTQLVKFGKAVHNSIGIGSEIKANEEVGIGPYIELEKVDYNRISLFAQALNPTPEKPPEPEPPQPEPPMPEPPKPEPEEKEIPWWVWLIAGVGLVAIILGIVF